MHITWQGKFGVRLVTGEHTIVLDPPPSFKGKATVVGLTNPNEPAMSHVSGVSGEPSLINTPGEYSFNGISLSALGWHDLAGNERALHRWKLEDMVLLHVGALDRPLTDTELRRLEQVPVDILLLPTGGGAGLELKDALSLMSTFEPRLVIPINFTSAAAFAKELGLDENSATDKLTIKKKSLPDEEMQAVILKS
jgi:L-ascorbate metabolism protein UlaG (beta-lactamase superfamily)